MTCLVECTPLEFLQSILVADDHNEASQLECEILAFSVYVSRLNPRPSTVIMVEPVEGMLRVRGDEITILS
jgi:hypothetical protein